MYNDVYHPQVKKDLKKIDPYIRKKIQSTHLPAILSNPSLGQMLAGNFADIRSYHFTVAKQQFRIAYMVLGIDIFILMIAKRSNFYTTLKKRT